MNLPYISLLFLFSFSALTYTRSSFGPLRKQLKKMTHMLDDMFEFENKNWNSLSKVDGIQISEHDNHVTIDCLVPLQENNISIDASIDIGEKIIHIQSPDGLIRIGIEKNSSQADTISVSMSSKERRETKDARGISMHQSISSKSESKVLHGTIELHSKEDVAISYIKDTKTLQVTLPFKPLEKKVQNQNPNQEPLNVTIK